MTTPKTKFLEQFVVDLHELGLRPGGVLLVHSSLKSFGSVPGGAETIIHGLQLALGGNGTLLMPALTYANVTPQNPIFDLIHTPSCVGLIPETFRSRPGTKRSLHPTHSVCGVGPLADELLANHKNDRSPCGPNSPFHLLPKFNAQILMLGCGLKPNTSMHAIEEVVEPLYLFNPPIIYALTAENGDFYNKEYIPHNFRGWRQRYDRVSKLLFEPDLRQGWVVAADSFLIEASALWKAALKACRKNSLFFVEGAQC